MSLSRSCLSISPLCYWNLFTMYKFTLYHTPQCIKTVKNYWKRLSLLMCYIPFIHFKCRGILVSSLKETLWHRFPYLNKSFVLFYFILVCVLCLLYCRTTPKSAVKLLALVCWKQPWWNPFSSCSIAIIRIIWRWQTMHTWS